MPEIASILFRCENIPMSDFHTPVMLDEVLDFLNVQPDHWYLDSNLGGGGHTDAILERGGKVIGLDIDPDAIREVAKNHDLTIQTIDDHLEAHSENLILIQSNFSEINRVIANLNETLPSRHPGKSTHPGSETDSGEAELPRMTITGVLFDLGPSSHQFDTAQRGFSFGHDAPLDMRMDPQLGVSAKDLVNGLHEKELTQLFWKLGEEKLSRQIAKKIVEYRQAKPIQTTQELAQVITSVHPHLPSDKINPATKVFQALRIAVNDELNSLKEALPQAFEALKPGGRVVVISFHSLEDRIVKNFFRELTDTKKAQLLTKKPLTPTHSEISQNPRSRSAKLRLIEKI